MITVIIVPEVLNLVLTNPHQWGDAMGPCKTQRSLGDCLLKKSSTAAKRMNTDGRTRNLSLPVTKTRRSPASIRAHIKLVRLMPG